MLSNPYLIGGAIGFLASLAAAWVVGGLQAKQAKVVYRRMVGNDYQGWGYEDDRSDQLVRRPGPASAATVEHLRGHMLRVSLRHDGREWHGELAMENANFGTLVWRYIDLQLPNEAFGVKRVMVVEGDGKVRLHLLGEEPFGRETLEHQTPSRGKLDWFWRRLPGGL